LAGVLISTLVAADSTAPHLTHPFPNETDRAFNTFSYFTIQSNLLVGAATLLLAIWLERSSTAFRVLRLSGLVAITVPESSITRCSRNSST
jgi:hypothetical protein